MFSSVFWFLSNDTVIDFMNKFFTRPAAEGSQTTLLSLSGSKYPISPKSVSDIIYTGKLYA